MRSRPGFVVPHLSASWSPLDLSGLLGWWDASDAATITESSGAVSQWDDKSGNGYHLTQGTGAKQPTTGTVTIGGLNALSFDPSSGTQCLKSATLGGLFPDEFTLYAVFERTGSAPAFPAVCTITTGNAGKPLDAYAFHRFYNADSFYYTSGMSSLNLGTVTGPTIIGWIGTNAGNDLIERVNGAVYATGADNTSWGGSDASQRIVAGSRDDEVTAFRGGIGEMIVCSAAVSDADRDAVEGYLNTKFSVY